jgi:hypothetical protein
MLASTWIGMSIEMILKDGVGSFCFDISSVHPLKSS